MPVLHLADRGRRRETLPRGRRDGGPRLLDQRRFGNGVVYLHYRVAAANRYFSATTMAVARSPSWLMDRCQYLTPGLGRRGNGTGEFRIGSPPASTQMVQSCQFMPEERPAPGDRFLGGEAGGQRPGVELTLGRGEEPFAQGRRTLQLPANLETSTTSTPMPTIDFRLRPHGPRRAAHRGDSAGCCGLDRSVHRTGGTESSRTRNRSAARPRDPALGTEQSRSG